MSSIILASQSPYRRAQLEAFGLKFTPMKPAVDEDALKRHGPSDLAELTRFLAKAKAESLRQSHPHALIIGSDQLVDLAGERLDKPGTRERARAQLLQMQGRSHRLITSVALVHGTEVFLHTEITTIRLRPLAASEIDDYLDVDQPYDCAGSYKIERAGIGLLESVSGNDPSAIQGLPLIGLCEGLRKLGIPIWRPR